MIGWLPFLIVLALLVLIQRFILNCLGRRVPVGDENGYVTCGSRPDPYAPGLFLRVPLMAWLSKQAHRFSDHPEHTLRSASHVVSMLSIIASMFSAQLLGGPVATLVVGVLLTLMPGRIILSHHLWPDVWLSLWLSLSCLVLVYPDLTPEMRALLLGSIAALAFLTRFDALLLAPLSGVALTPPSLWLWLLILLPTLTVFALLSIRNFRRYQIPWPDNTWMFNLMVSAAETDSKQSGPVLIEHGVAKAVTDWSALSYDHRTRSSMIGVYRLFLSPGKTLWGLLTRFWASLGPDSFVLHRLLPPVGEGYPDIPVGFNRILTLALVLAFPLFVSTTLLALLVSKPAMPIFLWPTLAVAFGSLIHNRTRYRQAWLPGAALVLATAVGEPDFWTRISSSESTLAWLISIGMASALIMFRVRPDVRTMP